MAPEAPERLGQFAILMAGITPTVEYTHGVDHDPTVRGTPDETGASVAQTG